MENLSEFKMKVLRLNQVVEITGLSHSTIYRMMNNDEFPLSFKLIGNIVGWSDIEVNEWIEEKMRAREKDAEFRRNAKGKKEQLKMSLR